MMSKTHLAVGLATSLLVIQPKTFEECAVAIIGGSIGGVLADNDILDNDYQSDALVGQLLAFLATGLCLFLDYTFELGICHSIMQHRILSIIGGIGFIILYIVGFCSDHRTFTHSFLAMILYAIAVALIYLPLSMALSIAYCTHLLLDVCNKKKVPLLYPLKFGICLKLCYANKTANRVLMYIGFSVSAILLTGSIIAICI